MVIRTLKGIIPLPYGKIATFHMCDKYGNIIKGHDVTATIRQGGSFIANFPVTGDTRGFCVDTDEGKKIFHVYERLDSNIPQIINLYASYVKRVALPTMEDADDPNTIENIQRLIESSKTGQAIFTTEEQEILCAYECQMTQDRRLCKLLDRLGDTNVGL